jgi:hypothetical protein
MQSSTGIVIGFVAGLVVSGGAVLLLREPAAPLKDESARVGELGTKIERLERSVSLLSSNLRSLAENPAFRGDQVAAGAPNASAARTAEVPTVEQRRVIESADALVDQAIQLGQWTQGQQADLSALTAGLPVQEQGRIQARVSAAINNDQIRFEPR